MAEAYGKLTGRPGICLVTRGPGATHASVGVHTAFQDSTPLILLVGQVASRSGGTRGVPGDRLSPHLRRDGQVGRADRQRRPDPGARRSRVHHRVRRPARARRPGTARGHAARASRPPPMPVRSRSYGRPRPHGTSIGSRRCSNEPSGRWPFSAAPAGRRPRRATCGPFLEANAIPAGAAFRRQDTLDNDSASYVGEVGIGLNPALAARVREADLILAVGPRLGEMTTSGYTLLDVPTPKQTLVHVHAGAEELGRVYQADLPILAGPAEFAAAVAGVRVEPRWRDWTAAARADFEAWQQNAADARRGSTWRRASRTCGSACPTRS